MTDSFSAAMTNRSLRAIKTELEFLLDANVISQQQFTAITAQLPANAASAASSRAPSAMPTPTPQPPVNQLANLHMNNTKTPEPEKKIGYYAQDNTANPPPPAYPSVPAAPAGPIILCHATALYQYNAQDAGDLALMPNDKITVHEYMNAEWWKGSNERTGQEGIFPASYVRKEEGGRGPVPPPAPSNYGNMPLDVSNSAGSHAPMNNGEPSKAEQNGKKFGKKLGNAAIFGAGATLGGNLVNSIF